MEHKITQPNGVICCYNSNILTKVIFTKEWEINFFNNSMHDKEVLPNGDILGACMDDKTYVEYIKSTTNTKILFYKDPDEWETKTLKHGITESTRKEIYSKNTALQAEKEAKYIKAINEHFDNV